MADDSHGAFGVVSPSLCSDPMPLAQMLELFVKWFVRSWLVDTVLCSGARSVLAEACSVARKSVNNVLSKIELSQVEARVACDVTRLRRGLQMLVSRDIQMSTPATMLGDVLIFA